MTQLSATSSVATEPSTKWCSLRKKKKKLYLFWSVFDRRRASSAHATPPLPAATATLRPPADQIMAQFVSVMKYSDRMCVCGGVGWGVGMVCGVCVDVCVCVCVNGVDVFVCVCWGGGGMVCSVCVSVCLCVCVCVKMGSNLGLTQICVTDCFRYIFQVFFDKAVLKIWGGLAACQLIYWNKSTGTMGKIIFKQNISASFSCQLKLCCCFFCHAHVYIKYDQNQGRA